jgi:serine/threonine-protein kinase
VYLSKDGTVKLGDFGIARSTTRTTLRSEAGHVLKGKFAYLAPEQVAGEASDFRADLFSLATVLAEMLLNRPLFPGGGQLAILLAIRDCKIDALLEIKPRMPPGLFEVMQRALARDPQKRYPTATDFANALAPFEADPRLAVREIAARVRWVQAAGSSDSFAAVRDSVRQLRSARPSLEAPVATRQAVESVVPAAIATPAPARPKEEPRREADDSLPAPPDRTTAEYQLLPSIVRKSTGEKLGPWSFARLMEALATGQIQRGDSVDFVGRGFKPVEEIEEFQRFLSVGTAKTGEIQGPGQPDFYDEIDDGTMLKTLMRVLAQEESGVLFVERADETGESGRKELYFTGGKLHHVASSNASELLGEYLVRRGKLEREELDLALAVLPRYGGRMGDTLISMGLVGPVDIFRAIREQGRDRVADLFLWKGGTVTFYRGGAAPHVEFPLDLDLAPLMLAGLEAAKPGEAPLEENRNRFDHVLGPATASDDLYNLDTVIWPPNVERVRKLLTKDTKLRDVLKAAVRNGEMTAGDALRAIELLVIANVIAWRR